MSLTEFLNRKLHTLSSPGIFNEYERYQKLIEKKIKQEARGKEYPKSEVKKARGINFKMAASTLKIAKYYFLSNYFVDSD